MLLDSWSAVARVLLSGLATYALLLALLRISGKRTLAKLNAFDLVVTVAMGSTLSSALLSGDVSVAEGVAGFVVLAGAQYAVARLSLVSPRFARVVRARPRLVLRDGVVLEDALRAERLARDDVLAAARQAGFARLADVGAVVMETDGSLSVLAPAQRQPTVVEGVHE